MNVLTVCCFVYFFLTESLLLSGPHKAIADYWQRREDEAREQLVVFENEYEENARAIDRQEKTLKEYQDKIKVLKTNLAKALEKKQKGSPPKHLQQQNDIRDGWCYIAVSSLTDHFQQQLQKCEREYAMQQSCVTDLHKKCASLSSAKALWINKKRYARREKDIAMKNEYSDAQKSASV